MMSGCTIPFLLGIPETSSPHILMKKAKRLRENKAKGYENVQASLESEDRKLASLFRIAFARPPAIFFDPIAFVISLYSALVYTLLYMLFAIYPIVFRDKRGWNSGVSELPLIGTVVGACIAGCFVFWNSRLDRKKMLDGVVRAPEDRLTMVSLLNSLMRINSHDSRRNMVGSCSPSRCSGSHGLLNITASTGLYRHSQGHSCLHHLS